MSLLVDFKPGVAARFHLWAKQLDIPVELYTGMLFLELFDLEWRQPNSPHYLSLPEREFSTEAERMTDDFVRSIRHIHDQNRAAITEAITRKHILMAEVDKLERQSTRLHHEASDALQAGNREQAKHCLKRKASCDTELAARRKELAAAESAVENFKRHIRQEEEQIKAQAAELPKQHPENMSAEERPAFTAELLAKMDALAFNAEAPPSGTEGNGMEDSQANSVTGIDATANITSQTSVESPVPVQPTSLTLEFSPASETLIAMEAQARGFSASEYLNVIAERLIELADLVTPAGMPLTRDADDFHSMPVEEILNQAVQEMKENQIRNRDYAVQAITQKNNLQAQVDKEERMLAEYQRKALKALEEGNRNLAEQFYKERRLHEPTCEIMRGLLAQATDLVDKVKVHIKQEEERIRVRTAKALLLKANLTASVIAFRLDILDEEMQVADTEKFQQNFDAWIQAQRPSHAD